MGKIIKTVILLSVILTCNVAFSQKFEPVQKLPDGKALIYIYRIGSMVGAAVAYPVYANQDEISECALKNDSYLYYFAKPGKYSIWDQDGTTDRIVALNVEAGKTYYVRANCCEFSLPPLEQAVKEIAKCNKRCKD